MLGCGLYLVATTATRRKVKYFCSVGFVSSFLFPIALAPLLLPWGGQKEPRWGTARSLHGTQRSWATCRPGPAGMAQCLDSVMVWCPLAVCHPKGSLSTLGASPCSADPAQCLKPLTGHWAGEWWGGWGGGQAEQWEDGAVDKASTTKPVWNHVIWHSTGSCS